VKTWDSFSQLWVVDFEFLAPPGDLPERGLWCAVIAFAFMSRDFSWLTEGKADFRAVCDMAG
jgi:hypothetical protein